MALLLLRPWLGSAGHDWLPGIATTKRQILSWHAMRAETVRGFAQQQRNSCGLGEMDDRGG